MRSRRPQKAQKFHRPQQRFAHRPAPSPERMYEMLEKSGISLNDGQLEQLWRYHNLLRLRNEDRELTRIIEFEAMVIKHYVDSMIVGKFLKLPSPIVDIGTGAGFPGVPLKILYPNLQLILAEPRPKRITFLNEVRKALGFKNVDIFEHKVVSASFKGPVKAVITRAVETLDKTILRTTGSLEKYGKLIFLKGPNVDPEIEEVKRRFDGKYKLVQDEAYRLPHTPFDRRLVVYERQTDREILPANDANVQSARI